MQSFWHLEFGGDPYIFFENLLMPDLKFLSGLRVTLTKRLLHTFSYPFLIHRSSYVFRHVCPYACH